ncbi:putative F-box/LRR-repeat protein 19 [Aristolochia californica]|uniref:putative F-box/LRR-repeat protein 19 n=1 Tax=Aristolochia californica TaxID=171875 RepID=UPI0035DDA009
MERPWDALPRPLLTVIFSKLSLEDRLPATFLVCRGWADAANDPQCWQSMLPEAISPEDAFIKTLDTLHPFPRPVDSFDALSRLRNLVRRAEGRITALYISPFLTNKPSNDDEILRYVAESCPHLKYLSLQGSFSGSEAAIIEVIHSCRKLELLDFSFSTCFSDVVLEELGSCCPNLCGIKRCGDLYYSEAYAIGWNLSQVKLLNLAWSSLCSRGLSTIVSGCHGLEYLDITGCSSTNSIDTMRDYPWEPLGCYIAMRGIVCSSMPTDI